MHALLDRELPRPALAQIRKSCLFWDDASILGLSVVDADVMLFPATQGNRTLRCTPLGGGALL